MGKKKRVIYYSDELNDDFASSGKKIGRKQIGKDYPYAHKNVFWRIGSFILYQLIATPLVFLFVKIAFGMRFRNLKNVRNLKNGYILYGNHTNGSTDAFIPSLIAFPRRSSLVSSQLAFSIPVVDKIIPLLGAIPLNDTFRGSVRMIEEMKARLKRGQAVGIYPEAHIWPFYNGVRPFTDISFGYAFMADVPAVGFAITYRQRKIFRNLPPLMTVTVGEPVYPEECADKTEMRNKIYDFISGTITEEKSFAYREYVKRSDIEE